MRVINLSVLAIALIAALGCSGFSSPDDVSDHIGRLEGIEYVREGGLTVGSSAMRMARIGVAAAGEQSPDLLAKLKDVQVGVYRAVDPSVASRGVSASDFARYEAVVELQADRGEDVLVLSRTSGGRTRELLAVIDGDQLLVIQVRGDLDDILEEVVRFAFGRAERSDLASPVLNSLESSPPG